MLAVPAVQLPQFWFDIVTERLLVVVKGKGKVTATSQALPLVVAHPKATPHSEIVPSASMV